VNEHERTQRADFRRLHHAAADYAARPAVPVLRVLWCAVRWLCWDSWRHALEEQRKETD